MRHLNMIVAALIACATPLAADAEGAARALPVSMEPLAAAPVPLRKPPLGSLPLAVVAGLPQGFTAAAPQALPDAARRALTGANPRMTKEKIRLIRSAPAGGPDLSRLHIVYDAADPGAAADWQAFLNGVLPESHPGFAVRSIEATRGLEPGSCLSVQSGAIFCGASAERLRDMADLPADPAKG